MSKIHLYKLRASMDKSLSGEKKAEISHPVNECASDDIKGSKYFSSTLKTNLNTISPMKRKHVSFKDDEENKVYTYDKDESPIQSVTEDDSKANKLIKLSSDESSPVSISDKISSDKEISNSNMTTDNGKQLTEEIMDNSSIIGTVEKAVSDSTKDKLSSNGISCSVTLVPDVDKISGGDTSGNSDTIETDPLKCDGPTVTSSALNTTAESDSDKFPDPVPVHKPNTMTVNPSLGPFTKIQNIFCANTISKIRKSLCSQANTTSKLSLFKSDSLLDVTSRINENLQDFNNTNESNMDDYGECVNEEQSFKNLLKRKLAISLCKSDGPSENSSDNKESFKIFLKNKLAVSLSKSDSLSLQQTSYTPLEEQVIELKQRHPKVCLMIECGYKYKFFGDDAEVAAKELDITTHLEHNFMTASIPSQRLLVHLKRLVVKGYKVGLVKQTESAVAKATSINKNGLLTRALTGLYTKSTFFGEEVQHETEENFQISPTPYLVSIFEGPPSDTAYFTAIGFMAINPSTGDIFYDSFDDNKLCETLESRLYAINPVEIILPDQAMSQECWNVVKDFCDRCPNEEATPRVERRSRKDFEYSNALAKVTIFIKKKRNDKRITFNALPDATSLPPLVICCLSSIITYLQDFNLEKCFGLCQFEKLSDSSKYMTLTAVTMKNLELFQNSETFSEQGSLYSIMNTTITKFGARILRQWLMRPLLDITSIENRQEMVAEMFSSTSTLTVSFKRLLSKMVDVEKILLNIVYQRCGTWDFYQFCRSLLTAWNELEDLLPRIEAEISSPVLKQLVKSIINDLVGVDVLLRKINESAAREENKSKVFVDSHIFPALQKAEEQIQSLEDKLLDIEVTIRQTYPALEFQNFVSVGGECFLVEVDLVNLEAVPENWRRVNGTKSCARFRTPEVDRILNTMEVWKDELRREGDKIWKIFLNGLSGQYLQLRNAIKSIGTLDVLLALAEVAKQDSYCRPLVLATGSLISIEKGKHPVVSRMMGPTDFVANDTELDLESRAVMVITGPNMGGKSCYVRQVALMTIMAQIGSFIPANSATLGILDGIYTRMGGSDDICHNKSTFMLEMEQTSEIMRKSTTRSLVILDELGRGTSTNDGVAIAYATLDYFVREVGCLTLFVTHHPMMAEFEGMYPAKVGNFHMSFMIHKENALNDEEKKCDVVTFLYEMVPGAAEKSYGLNVARLAGIPQSVLNNSTQRSSELEQHVTLKRKAIKLFQGLWEAESKQDIFNALQLGLL